MTTGATWKRAMAVGLALMALVGAPTVSHATGCGRNSTQADLDVCADQAFKASDAALNSTYRQVADRLKGEAATRMRLTAAERAWLAFRDAECNLAASGVVGGTIYPMIVSQCRNDLTQSRTRQLTAYLHCAEGDVSCPVPPP